jgi:hypothetical protein
MAKKKIKTARTPEKFATSKGREGRDRRRGRGRGRRRRRRRRRGRGRGSRGREEEGEGYLGVTLRQDHRIVPSLIPHPSQHLSISIDPSVSTSPRMSMVWVPTQSWTGRCDLVDVNSVEEVRGK